jgi:hypothetical protein
MIMQAVTGGIQQTRSDFYWSNFRRGVVLPT